MKRVLVAGVLGSLLLLGAPTLASSAPRSDTKAEKGDGAKGGDSKGGGHKSGDNKSGGNKSGDIKSGGNKSGGNKSGGNKSGDIKSGGNKSGGNKSGGNKSGGNKSGDIKSGGNKSGGNKSGDNKGGGDHKGDRGDRGYRGDRDGRDRDGRSRHGYGRQGHHRGGYYGGGYGYGGSYGEPYDCYYGANGAYNCEEYGGDWDPYGYNYRGSYREGHVVVRQRAFSPQQANARPGQTVLWQFADGDVAHTVTADNRSFDSGQKVNDEFQLRFQHPGTYSYHCALHPEMRGRVVVG